MGKEPRSKLTLRSKPKGKGNSCSTFTVFATPTAYVAPEPTEKELEEMPIGQRINYEIGTNVNEFEWVNDGVVTHANIWNDYWEEDDSYDTDDDGPIDDRATAAYLRDWQQSVAHDPNAPYGVEIGGSSAALKELLLAVALEMNRWKKTPKTEATAAGIGLAIAQIRKERGVKHPRDIAKEVGVRAQTLHAIKNVALQEIQRLNLAQALSNDEPEETGTYNENEREENQDDDPPFLLP